MPGLLARGDDVAAQRRIRPSLRTLARPSACCAASADVELRLQIARDVLGCADDRRDLDACHLRRRGGVVCGSVSAVCRCGLAAAGEKIVAGLAAAERKRCDRRPTMRSSKRAASGLSRRRNITSSRRLPRFIPALSGGRRTYPAALYSLTLKLPVPTTAPVDQRLRPRPDRARRCAGGAIRPVAANLPVDCATKPRQWRRFDGRSRLL